ncbi:uncharacterized protein BT62DRAFT_275856 [Guyanagaster necrorhizus]|uniref:Uncharacterized protein n=1 Tax=Guyanagaster necrorhizus TaxID=856835 RepID=A0A9P7W4W9_9AGAR|nr:uncharacterized protein BT62DRAFT_275856 [Guyanagaster necrorhizus MCA 3950]KAG7452010.1 hypothetical protein BT62DRAFT_275856 [Guyanagaster necrorhizus MCA 3950]
MSSAEPDFSAIHPSTSARTDGDNIGLDNRGSTGIDLGDNSRNFVTSQRGVGPWGPDQWMQQNDLQPDQCMNMYLLHNDLATCSVQPAPRYGSLHSYSERPHAPAQSAYGAPVSSHVHTFDARIANHGDMHLSPVSLGKPQYGINASTPATFQSSQGQSQGYSPMAQVPLGMDMLTSPCVVPGYLLAILLTEGQSPWCSRPRSERCRHNLIFGLR